jgi:hypothetical protein
MRSDGTAPKIEDALAYWAQGMSVVPLWHGTKISALGKGRIQRYQQRPATREELERWFAEEQRNIGVMTGAVSQLLVLDLDGEEGRAFLNGKTLPPTPMVETPSDSLHLYFRMPEVDGTPWKCHAATCGHKGVDLRGNKGYVADPPSILTPYVKRNRTYPGGRYAFPDIWEVSRLRADLTDPPDWLIDLWQAADRTPQLNTPAGREASSEYVLLASPTGKWVGKESGLREQGVAELARDAVAESMCARFLGLSKIPEDIGKHFHCVLPGHDEHQTSASLYRGATGSLMYRDWHRRSGHDWYLLPEVYASTLTGNVACLPAPSLAVWRIRLWFAAGILERPTVPLPPIPKDVPTSIRRVYEGFQLLVACKWTYEPGTPTECLWRFAAGWCGVGERQAGEAIAWLLKHQVIRQAGTYHRAMVFLPGTGGTGSMDRHNGGAHPTRGSRR